MIQIENLQFSWPGSARPTLSIPEFKLAKAEHLFLHGPSGSGKSTLLSLLTGIHLPQSGRIKILGQDLSRLSGPGRDRFRADHLGYVFQQFNLLPYLSVLDNVLLPCQFSKLRRQRTGEPKAQALHLLERLDLHTHLHQSVSALSVGQQQRVALARALIGAPEILIADEPTSALDAERRGAFIELLFECAKEHQTAILLVSHDPQLAMHFDRSVSLPAINTMETHDV
ncbi:ABC transporter ATP-binding protein [Iodobacter fluviatilis]|uniref:ABC transport system ATP-binding protein n=1 Tax=Iodobacter fluviatilis TaxID=537 RepID=A0A377Q7W8_9NEIS|nr:ABC transporter ATP-binding protein [Iodobacter fluviatilis]TCU88573.1 putative ABC transport system ATP-binding protein [Iodobacter fluviatilis]STQ91356.1 Lipoprotein-releasing system ATP-binding protein LolD [Iodobacter fluviatilis]